MQLEEISTEQSSCVEAVKVLWKGVNCSVKQCWREGGRQSNRSQEQPVNTVRHQLSSRRWLLPSDMSIHHSLMSGYKLVMPVTSRLTIFYKFIISFLTFLFSSPSTAYRFLVPQPKLPGGKTQSPNNGTHRKFSEFHLLKNISQKMIEMFHSIKWTNTILW